MSITRAFTSLFLAALVAATAAGQVTFDRVMITEVSWGDPDGLEIANFTAVTHDLSNWTVVWDDGTAVTSAPLGVVLPAGDLLVVKEPGNVIEELPAGVQVATALPSVGTTTQAFEVSLRDAFGFVVDVVRISDTAGASPVIGIGGPFRGLAVRGAITGGSGDVSVERIWRLDSNCGLDWTEQPDRSFGLENRSSGPPGFDAAFPPPTALRINEIDPVAHFIELHNPNAVWVDLEDWFLLVSRIDTLEHDVIRPFPASFPVPPGGYVVVGTGPAPAEMPIFAPYADTVAAGTVATYFLDEGFSVALYDHLGRVRDVVRTTGADDGVVHNHPRAPARWDAFTGAAGRSENGGTSGIGRAALGADTDRGSDWSPVFERTMGSANAGFAGLPGPGDRLDVRIDETPNGDGLTIIVNAGPVAAGGAWSFFFSFGHLGGHGPGIGGLGADALVNWLDVSIGAGLSGALDAQGSGRYDLAPGSLPPGVDIDCIFLVQVPGDLLVTSIVQYDT